MHAGYKNNLTLKLPVMTEVDDFVVSFLISIENKVLHFIMLISGHFT